MHDSEPIGGMMPRKCLEGTLTDNNPTGHNDSSLDMTFQECALQKPRIRDFVAQTVIIQ